MRTSFISRIAIVYSFVLYLLGTAFLSGASFAIDSASQYGFASMNMPFLSLTQNPASMSGYDTEGKTFAVALGYAQRYAIDFGTLNGFLGGVYKLKENVSELSFALDTEIVEGVSVTKLFLANNVRFDALQLGVRLGASYLAIGNVTTLDTPVEDVFEAEYYASVGVRYRVKGFLHAAAYVENIQLPFTSSSAKEPLRIALGADLALRDIPLIKQVGIAFTGAYAFNGTSSVSIAFDKKVLSGLYATGAARFLNAGYGVNIALGIRYTTERLCFAYAYALPLGPLFSEHTFSLMFYI